MSVCIVWVWWKHTNVSHFLFLQSVSSSLRQLKWVKLLPSRTTAPSASGVSSCARCGSHQRWNSRIKETKCKNSALKCFENRPDRSCISCWAAATLIAVHLCLLLITSSFSPPNSLIAFPPHILQPEPLNGSTANDSQNNMNYCCSIAATGAAELYRTVAVCWVSARKQLTVIPFKIYHISVFGSNSFSMGVLRALLR